MDEESSPGPLLLTDVFQPTSALTIGLLDGNDLSRSVIERTLSCIGHRVRSFSAIDELAPTWQEASLDVLIVDDSSWSAAGASTESRDRPPVLLVASPEEPASSLRSDADECIARPIQPAELLRRLDTVLRLRRDGEELAAVRELRGEQTRMWNVLIEFSRSVARLLDLESTLDAIVVAASELTSSRRVSLMLPDEQVEYLTIAKAIGIDQGICQRTRIRIGESVAGHAFESGQSVTSLAQQQRITGDGAYGVESFVSMPISTASLKWPAKRVGVLNITNRLRDRPFADWELEFVEILGKIAGAAIDDTMWRIARESMLRIERDIEVARQIQQSTFPTSPLILPGYSFAGLSEPAEETGGDTYDIIGLATGGDGRREIIDEEPDRVVLLVADATGHGIGPAISVTQVRAMLRIAVRAFASLDDIARLLNQQLCSDLPAGRFITAWLAELDPTLGVLKCINAGGGPTWHISARDGTVREIPTDTVPLGITSDLPLPVATTVPMGPGDSMVVVSDGIVDARDSAGTFFGAARLSNSLAGDRHVGADHVLEAIRTAVREFAGEVPADDDRTMLVVSRCAS